MNEVENIVKDFKEGQEHQYQRGYWAGKMHPMLKWLSPKKERFLRKFYLIFFIIVLLLILLTL